MKKVVLNLSIIIIILTLFTNISFAQNNYEDEIPLKVSTVKAAGAAGAIKKGAEAVAGTGADKSRRYRYRLI